MILVTGGLGYIGSHTIVELLNNGYDVVVLDNLSNTSIDVKDKIKKITGKDFKVYIGDILDKELENKIFKENKIDAVIHFAGLKAVGESSVIPLEYYKNNVEGTLHLLEVMKANNCKSLVFSSSATVYGAQDIQPLKESAPLQDPTNPYGRTKRMIEDILKDLYKSDNSWNIILLRYFNPIGAHQSGLIGEKPNGIPNNLMPYITQTAIGVRDHLNVFGNDYKTHDGTGVRDYIHVVDLARGHVLALNKINKDKKESKGNLDIYNLGTGVGYSVLDIVNTFKKVNNIDVPYVIAPRRAGDIDCCYADPTKAYKELGFKCEKNLSDMCKDSWNFQKNLNEN
ncbi:MAG: UDP-glucose 4-epimerase GalE [Bacilli bacterium]|nr:UDP-glucose 4-epimerase GalE [Bacilli bacterium]